MYYIHGLFFALVSLLGTVGNFPVTRFLFKLLSSVQVRLLFQLSLLHPNIITFKYISSFKIKIFQIAINTQNVKNHDFTKYRVTNKFAFGFMTFE